MTPRTWPMGRARLQQVTTESPNHTTENIMLGMEPRDLKQHPPPALNPRCTHLRTHPGIDQLMTLAFALSSLHAQTFAVFVKVAVQGPPIGDEELCS
jgi:hypothetical protein